MLTNMGDLEDLLNAFPSKPTTTVQKPMDCSGLVKVIVFVHFTKWIQLLPDHSDIFVGHTTFNGYQYMLRIFKHYTLNLRNEGNFAQTMSLSSRPGDLESKDDYYILSR
jgi:hypothetical protein